MERVSQTPVLRRRRWVAAVGTMVGVAALIFGLDSIEVPHPWIYSPDSSSKKIQAVPEGRRWMVTHGYGALSAQTLDISAFRDRVDALPDGLEHAYYDGAAHHFRFAMGDIDGTVSDIETHIPGLYRVLFYDGMVRRYTLAHASDPNAVIAWTEKVSSRSGERDLVNGIRIGIQQALGSTMDRAIAVAAMYPPAMHHELYEELGWRVGDEDAVTIAAYQQYQDSIPPPARCSFAEGMTRGRILWLMAEEMPWWSGVSGFHESMSDQCADFIESGIAEALLIAVGDRPTVRREEAQTITDAQVRSSVFATMAQRLEAANETNRPQTPSTDSIDQ